MLLLQSAQEKERKIVKKADYLQQEAWLAAPHRNHRMQTLSLLAKPHRFKTNYLRGPVELLHTPEATRNAQGWVGERPVSKTPVWKAALSTREMLWLTGACMGAE